MAGLIVGVCVAGIGISMLLDVRGYGTRVMRLNLYIAASPWSRSPEPSHERVDRHRVVFGTSVLAIGLVTELFSLVALV